MKKLLTFLKGHSYGQLRLVLFNQKVNLEWGREDPNRPEGRFEILGADAKLGVRWPK